MTYYFCAAWPGKTPHRQHAYRQSRAVFDVLLDGVAALLKFQVERNVVEVEGQQVAFHVLLPLEVSGTSTTKLPAIFPGNGLKGVDQEFIVPLLRLLSGTPAAFFVAGLPGTYAFRAPMVPPAPTESSYDALHARFRAHPRVDPHRFGILGLSFGANWATRMLVRDTGRIGEGAIIKAAVINGPPNQQTFNPTGTLGIPQIMVEALGNTAGVSNPRSLLLPLQRLIVEPAQIRNIAIPLLVVNGDTDTFYATADAVDIARLAQHATLKLYPDDHCAMDHMEDHLRLSIDFLVRHL